jgi:hypothetical protein
MRILIAFLFTAAAFAQNSPVFPARAVTNADLFVASNDYVTTLTLGINSTATTVTVPSTSGFTAPGIIAIDSEAIAVCSVASGTTFTVGFSSCPNVDGRGFDNTSAATHLALRPVNGRLVPRHHNQIAADLIATESATPNVVSDLAVASFTAGCSSGGRTLLISKVWTALTTQSCAAPIAMQGGGKLQPANGQTITISLVAAPMSTVCDVSLGGNCIINTPNGVVLPEWWGAAGGQDSTAAWQALLNTTSTTNNSLRIATPIANGNAYNISTTLFHSGVGVSSLTIEGPLKNGSGASTGLQWTGASGGMLMHLQNESNLVIRGMQFKGNELAKTLLALDYSGSGNLTAFDLIENSSFAGIANVTDNSDIRLNDPACPGITSNSSEIYLHNVVLVGGASHTGRGVWDPCGGNSQNFVIDGNAGTIAALTTGIELTNAASAFVVVRDMFMNNNGLDIKVLLGSLIVSNVTVEASGKFIYMGAGGNGCSLKVEGSHWNSLTASTDDVVIDTQYCAVTLENNTLNNSRVPGVSLPKVLLRGLTTGACGSLCGYSSLFSHGNAFLYADATHGAYYDSGGNPVGVPYGAYFTNNLNQLPIEVFGDFGSIPGLGGSAIPLPNFSPFMARQFTPANSAANCTPPQISYDTSFMYACTAPNTWVSVPKTTAFGINDFVTTAGAQNVSGSKDFLALQRFDKRISFGGQPSISSVAVAGGIEFRGIPIGTSSTSTTIGAGARTFTVVAGLDYRLTDRLWFVSDANDSNSMTGTVTSYVGTSLVMNIDTTTGSGTFSDWTISPRIFYVAPLGGVATRANGLSNTCAGAEKGAVTAQLVGGVPGVFVQCN